MRIQKIFIAFTVLATLVTGCIQDDFGVPGGVSVPGESGSVIILSSGRTDGMVTLAVDAPLTARSGVWIDLNGDGIRAEDGTEDIEVFNVYQDYKLLTDKKNVSVYGDITYLAAVSNELTALDVSRNSSLQTLNVRLNQLSALDVSKNSALIRLDCSSNNLTSLDVSQNKSLVSLWTFDNQLSELNMSGNTNLAFLDCSNNKLSALDVTGNKDLIRLLCYKNQLSSLDLTQNVNLGRLWIFDNPISTKEMERIITSLQKVANGSLWIANEQIAAGLEEQLIEKGWAIK